MQKKLLKKDIKKIVSLALQEDVGQQDITTTAIAKPNDYIAGAIIVQAAGVIAGLPLVKEVFSQLNKEVELIIIKKEGQKVKKGDKILILKGNAAAILTGERTALNFLALLSGIATITNKYVEMAKNTRTEILDTRKTPPGLRTLVKYAVSVGGGTNHRFGLYDGILIKDNHIKLAGSLKTAIARVRKNIKNKDKSLLIEVEAENLAEVSEALAAKADIILLDNMSLSQLKQAKKIIGKKAKLEVSGGLTLKMLRNILDLNLDRASIGALTHSTTWLSMHLEID